jgi:hypothetical protein
VYWIEFFLRTWYYAGVLLNVFTNCCNRLESDGRRFEELMVPGLKCWALPWFGDLEKAQILTVGVNPSPTEFEKGRWQQITTPAQAFAKVNGYFRNPECAHPWFATWEKGLKHVNASYTDNAKFLAAHVDLSPRATRVMSKLPVDSFLGMIRHDLPHFAEVLNAAPSVRAIFMAGTVTKRFYMNGLLSKQLWSSTFTLTREAVAKGRGAVSFPFLKIGNREIRVFFCSSSPSARNKSLLIERVRQHAPTLESWLS